MPFASVLARALALAVTAAPAVSAQDLTAQFDLFVSGIKAGEMTIGSSLSGDRYSAETDMTAAGLVGAFAEFYYKGAAEGRVNGDGEVVPQTFVALSKSSRAERETRIDFENGTPVSVSVEPPRDSAPDPATQGGTLDPISAGFLLLRDAPKDEICSRTVDIFDGSRRSRLTLGAPTAEGDQIVCDGRIARIEGEAHSMSGDEKEYPFRMVFRDGDDGIAEFQRIESRTRFGKAVIERRG